MLKNMNIDQATFFIAGIAIVVFTLFGMLFGGFFHLLTLLVGVDLIQAPITGFCPLAQQLRKMGWQPGALFKETSAGE